MRRAFVFAAILNPSATITSCDNAGDDQLCSFGRPALSPDGARIIVRRHPQDSGFPVSGSQGAGTLELLES